MTFDLYMHVAHFSRMTIQATATTELAYRAQLDYELLHPEFVQGQCPDLLFEFRGGFNLGFSGHFQLCVCECVCVSE